MPTNDERREVAARLRALDVYEFDDGEYIDEGDVENALGIINVDGAWFEAVSVMRLAELIEPEERTCIDDGVAVFRCTSCGAFALPGAVTDLCSPIPIRYCPNCGARVLGKEKR